MTAQELAIRFWHDLMARPDGPLALRFVLQPTIASLLAIRDGIKDAKAERPPFLRTIVSNPAARAGLLREGWHSVSRVFGLAVLLDVIYQLIVLKALRPLESVVVAVVLAYLPYMVVRGPVMRIVRARRRAKARREHAQIEHSVVGNQERTSAP